jgi:hypothetical protein
VEVHVSAFESARLAGEIIGVLLVAGSGFIWIVKLLWRTNTKLDGVNDRLDKLNGSVARHEGELSKQKELNAYLKGTIGMSLKESGEDMK